LQPETLPTGYTGPRDPTPVETEVSREEDEMHRVVPVMSILAAMICFSTVAGATAPVHPLVLTATENGQTSDFFVVLKQTADLTPAAELPSKTERGQFVVNALRAVADSSQAGLKAMLDARGIRYRAFYIVNAILVTGNRALVEEIAARPEVARIEANPKIRVEMPSRQSVTRDAPSGIEWNVAKVHAPEAWALGYTGQGIVVGGADTGIDWDHPALKNHYRGWNGLSANHDYNWHDSIHVGGSSCGADSPEPCDDYGHGTHTIGTAVGDDGGSNQIGVAPGAKFIGCRNMNSGVGTPARYIECMEWFLAPYPVGGTPAEGDPSKAPDVTNNSWNCTPSEGCSWDTLKAAVEAQRAAGIMMVVSAGNSGPSCGSVSEPAAIYDASYTVGSTTSSDTMSSFSSRGPAVANQGDPTLNKPDIVAPGSNIRSCVPGGGYEGGWSGTSMAGPHIAGAVAVVWSARPDLKNHPELTEAVLNSHARRLTGSVEGCGGDYVNGPNNTWGYGLVDLEATLAPVITLAPTDLAITELGGTPNGVVEPAEWTTVSPSWTNTADSPSASITGEVSSATPLSYLSSDASYGIIPAGAEVSCSASNDCYLLRTSGPRPATHWDVTLHEVLSSGDAADWTLHIGSSFSDVPTDFWAYRYVETVLHNAITAGCGGGLYCPTTPVSRWQMAVFISLAVAGGAEVPPVGTIGDDDYDCSPGGISLFSDIAPEDPACKHVHAIAARGITVGCGGGAYCPANLVSRWQMAVFMAKAMLNGAPIPVSGTVTGFGSYDCSPSGHSLFSDVAPEDAWCSAVHYLAAEEVTAGCGGGAYCPADSIARDQMAVFLTKAFALTIYGP